MADALVSRVVEQLISTVDGEAKERVGLVMGVEKEMDKLVRDFQLIRAVLVDAEQRKVHNSAVRFWLHQVMDTSYDMEDVLDEWNTARLKLQIEGVDESALVVPHKKVCSFLSASCFGFKQMFLRVDIALKIRAIRENLDDITNMIDLLDLKTGHLEKSPDPRFRSTSLVIEDEVYGRYQEKASIISKLLSESSEKLKGLHIISIVGMGGIGKTTLAQLAYNDDMVRKHFDKRIWVCVSNPFDEFKIAKSIIEALEGSVPNFMELESLLQYISKSIVGKKFLLVLDDVWNEDYYKWELFRHCLMNGLRGSKILITTRMENVAHMMQSTDIIAVRGLSEEESWSLFKMIAFSGRSPEEELRVIGMKIVGKCNGLPLAIKAVGSLLRFKTAEEWLHILHGKTGFLEGHENPVVATLLLSYNDLPSTVRQCFSYCAIFPKDFQIEKDKLVKLWMAEGYLGMGEGVEMEKIGQKYFDLLAARFFFQDFEKDYNGDILSCKMHDLVHDLAQFLTKNESFTKEDDDGLQATFINDNKLRRIMLTLNKGVSFPVSVCSAKKVRSLLIQYGVTNCSSISEVLPLLFSQLTSLRALDLSGQLWFENVVIKIGSSIWKLILLRYLNLSLLKIEELPEELCELYNLQTLELSGCTNLKKLPEGMGRLIKLRHLVNVETSLSYMPRGIEKLICLRTLSEFVVRGGSDGSKACTLACLKNLNYLQGSLSIKNLAAMTDFSEFEEANLQNKRNIDHLFLNFENVADEVKMNKDVESKMYTNERVFEASHLPPDLEFLEIRGYKGNSDLIMLGSLCGLRALNLLDCTNLDRLPPLGRLPSLESLSIYSAGNVKRVGHEFLGTESDGASSSSPPFPKLTSLKFVNMENWEVWHCGMSVMPFLRSLSLVHCPKLKALPGLILQTKTLEELNINWCPFLKSRYNMWTGYDLHKMSHVRNIMINFEYLQSDKA